MFYVNNVLFGNVLIFFFHKLYLSVYKYILINLIYEIIKKSFFFINSTFYFTIYCSRTIERISLYLDTIFVWIMTHLYFFPYIKSIRKKKRKKRRVIHFICISTFWCHSSEICPIRKRPSYHLHDHGARKWRRSCSVSRRPTKYLSVAKFFGQGNRLPRSQSTSEDDFTFFSLSFLRSCKIARAFSLVLWSIF